MDKLYHYTFHYNPYTKRWAAIPRGKEKAYFNQGQSREDFGILYAEDISYLINFITGGG